MELPRLTGAKAGTEWQPMSALMWVAPSSRCISLMALNTGRSGQPVQKFGGRGGMSPTGAAAPALGAGRRVARSAAGGARAAGVGIDVCGQSLVQDRGQPLDHHLRAILAGGGQAAIAE